MSEESHPNTCLTLALSGDVMTGRGIDQILAHPCNPRLHEQHLSSALDYVSLAEHANGPIPRPVDPSYIWGAALDELHDLQPDAFIVNLETSVTQSEQAEPKGINYRMSPANIGCLTAAKIDCCVLANNHVLDWGPIGLEDTLAALSGNGLRFAGAGHSDRDAMNPATIDLGSKGRVLIYAMAATDSGVSRSWAAAPGKPGVNLLDDLSTGSVEAIASLVRRTKRPGDVAVASIHWGSNWGYAIPAAQRRFAHALIDEALVDVVHGHSSHHPKSIEVYQGKLVIFGCGDFLNDYEGIGGYEEFRPDLVLLYVATIEPGAGLLRNLSLVPFRIRRFRLERPSTEDTNWLFERLGREYGGFDINVRQANGGHITVDWK